MSGWFHMGGYGAFVWPAFGLTFVVMAAMVIATLASLRARRRELDRLEASLTGRPRRSVVQSEQSEEEAGA